MKSMIEGTTMAMTPKAAAEEDYARVSQLVKDLGWRHHSRRGKLGPINKRRMGAHGSCRARA